MKSAVVIGAGHNGLTAAFYLAKAGVKTIVLEARDTVGGGAITGDLGAGFVCPTLAHHTSLWTGIVRDMGLAKRGVEFLAPTTAAFAPALDGPSLTIHDDDSRTAAAIHRLSARDAEAYPAWRAALRQAASVAASVLASPAPRIDHPDARDLWNLLKAGTRFRSLGRKDSYRLLRWIPMPAADLVGEWFEGDLLRATIAAPGLSGTMLGPRSAGSSLVLLLREAHSMLAGGASRVRGGPGALTAAMAAAARDAGADVRTGARVERILVEEGAVAGVVVDGKTLAASTVVSAADPKTTYLRLVDPADLDPEFLAKMRNYRASGTMAKINLALAALPSFGDSRDASPDALSGRIHIGPGLDYLEQAFDHAKYGECSRAPWLDVTIPSILDPGLSPPGAHVMSIYSHYAPYTLRGTDWPASRDPLLESVLATLERFAPGIRRLVVAAQVVTPLQLDTDYGFHGGHGLHGELALDQLAMMRPILGHGRYAGPIAGLYHCSAGTPPGGFMTGGSGKLAAREIAAALAGR